jgi:carbamoyltransferase
MKDGEILSSVQQEKFDRIKNSGGFPKDAIDWTLRFHALTPDQLDAVAVSGLIIIPSSSVFGLAPVASSNSESPLMKVWRYMDFKHPPARKLLHPISMRKREEVGKKGRQEMAQQLSKTYGIPESKVHFVEHHKCHAYSAYYGQRNNSKKAAVITVDGEGDYYSGGVNVADNESIERISSTPWYNSLGYIYSQTTMFLGMKPLEHEYKVMGLAPYAKGYFMKTYKRIFEDTLKVDKDNLTFTTPFPTNRYLMHLVQTAVGERFDNVSAAVQHLTEVRMEELVKAAADKLGTDEFYFGGGVFMNVKMNMKLLEMDGIKMIHPFPSCGDESNPFGACYYVWIHQFSKAPSTTKRVKDLYLGPAYSNESIEDMIKRLDLKRKYKVEFHKDMEGTIADLLAKKETVARLFGRCEWGARSLCNRCIFGNPSTMETFYKVNDQIKMRDFWMPFAPAILKERESDYILNPKGMEAPYMIMAFHSTKLAQKELVASIHQADKTCRPQVLEKDWNPSVHRIIKEFEKETGIGAVLNTSFNLHGEPIVCSPEDALHTLENSGLEYLALENWMISKK